MLNLKDEYNRCVIPDIALGERQWREGAHSTEVKIEKPPRRRIERAPGGVKYRENYTRLAKSVVVKFRLQLFCCSRVNVLL